MFGHRNGSEWFRIIPECLKGLPETPGKLWAIMGHEGREKAAPGSGARPPMRSPNWTRGRGRGPPFLLPLPLFSFPSPILVGLGKGSPTPTGRRTPPPLARLLGRPASPLLLYIRGQGGTPKTHKLILEIVP